MGSADAAGSSPVPAGVARRAVEWLVELQSGEGGDATCEAMQQWRAEHPDHERAWQRIATVNARWRGALGGSAAAAQLAHDALIDTPAAPARPLPRRDAVKALAVVLCAGGGAWLAREHTPWREWSADARTGVGQRRTVVLADGSTVSLNSGSAIDVRFTSTERRLRLVGGEILVSTGKDRAARPFIVETAEGELHPLGTRFAVRQHAGASRVDVFEGAVAVRPRHAAPVPLRILRAGEQARFSAAAVAAPQAADDDSMAWTDGMLVASGMRLDDFLAELGRHRHGRLGCDSAIAGLRVSGSYPLADTDRILDTLRTTLPVEIDFLTRYWVTLRPARR
ncbi:histidine kinase [Massilia violaceinigra]|uniref:Histidine kinase n=1 Tax=Massilia violaceinigra TaxID=2045208 RepID=A0A2D2DPD5_9BURK|nr:FecR domain-containing protein [Massilia violaceinigra]ATQ76835.1 histidine kinase [Massilia violaceinigra]